MGRVYSSYKVFNYSDKIASLPKTENSVMPPLHVRIKPINMCNHRCSYCAYRGADLQLGQDMQERDVIPGDKMIEIIDDIIEMGVKAVTFSGGGEPLLYPFLADVLEKLADSPVRFATLTNGARLNGKLAELFAYHGTWVRVSMDGWDDRSYTTYRSASDREYSKIVNNMKAFKHYDGPCILGVSLIVDHNNAEHVFEFIKAMADIGVDSVKISPCIVSNEGSANNDYHKPIFNKVKDQILRAQSKISNPQFEIFDAYHELDEKFDKAYDWCPYCQILPVIGADMNVYTCQDKAYNLNSGRLGSIADQRFKSFWFNGKEKFFSINPSIHCHHHCVANNKNSMLYDYLNSDPIHMGFV